MEIVRVAKVDVRYAWDTEGEHPFYGFVVA
jgi:hypothetical protein